MVRPSLSPLRTAQVMMDMPIESENEHNSVAEVERWLTSPVVTQRSSQSEAKHQSQPCDAIDFVSQKRTNDASNATYSAANRGKSLLRERLKQKAMREQQKKLHNCKQETDPSQSTLPPVKTDSIHIATDNHMVKPTIATGNTTPSTAASTRSSYSKTVSLTNTMSGLTLSDSQSSPQEKTLLTPKNLAHHPRRSIEITDMEAIQYPRYPAPPKLSGTNSASLPISPTSTRSSSSSSDIGSGTSVPRSSTRFSSSRSDVGSGTSVPRSSTRSGSSGSDIGSGTSAPRSSTRSHSNGSDVGSCQMSTRSNSCPSSSKVHSPEMLPVTTKSSSVSDSSKLRSPETLLRISQQTGPRMLIYRQSQPSQPESDEEREKVDASNRQRAQTKIVDHRQQHVPSIPRKNRIRLHVYDLIAQETIMQLPWGCHFPIGQCFNALNSGLHTLGTGAYHVGIEINGIEYAYGANDTRGLTGVFTCMPKCSPGYQYRTTIDLGDRALLRRVQSSGKGEGQKQRYVDGREVVREMAAEYLGADYDLFRKNCVTFAHDACLRLGVQESEVPEWFRNLCVAGAAAQDAANSTMAPLTRVFSSCDREGLAGIVKDAGFEVISDDKVGHSEHIVETNFACSRPQ